MSDNGGRLAQWPHWDRVSNGAFTCFLLGVITSIAAVISSAEAGQVTALYGVVLVVSGMVAAAGLAISVFADKRAVRSRDGTVQRGVVEVAVLRTSCSPCEVVVFLDGEPLPITTQHEVEHEDEPGGYTVEEWREMAEEAVSVPGRSDAWAATIRGYYRDGEAVLRDDDEDDEDDDDQESGHRA